MNFNGFVLLEQKLSYMLWSAHQMELPEESRPVLYKPTLSKPM